MSECEKYNATELDSFLFKLQTKIATTRDGKLKRENFCKIVSLYLKIKELEGLGITADTYGNKVKAYKAFRQTALQDYGIKLNENYPFENPTNIYKQIDLILRSDNLNRKQTEKFYDFTGIRKRPPKSTTVEPTIKFQEYIKNLLESVSDEESLPIEDDNDISEDPYYASMTEEEYNENCKLRYEENAAHRTKKMKEDKIIEKIKKLQCVDPLS